MPSQEKMLSKKKSFKESIDQEKLILARFNSLKEKSIVQQANVDHKNNQNIKKMLDYDPYFKLQLQNVPADTIYTINKMFIDIDK
jgi:hypothetical protein